MNAKVGLGNIPFSRWIFQRTCAIAVPKKCTKQQRRPADWWTNKIADLRRNFEEDLQGQSTPVLEGAVPRCRPESVWNRPRREIGTAAPCSPETELAMQVVAGVNPIDLLTQKRHFVHHKRPVLGKEVATMFAWSTGIETWQSRWEQEPRGRWTARLITRLTSWLNREAGGVDFYLTQFLTGHGLFCSILAKMRKVADDNCPYSDSTVDDAHLTFF
ncbi:uncharacterized protein LOC118450816 [Vespa mandarinia]|uniref:uncharacterized protein LOC118450816 n=1 Tax=Vespa mandarinia TaxID=7446 RepID=UPI00161C21AE|nr:uncharacterized protein LOC118450816 [Vespa mandarinia]